MSRGRSSDMGRVVLASRPRWRLLGSAVAAGLAYLATSQAMYWHGPTSVAVVVGFACGLVAADVLYGAGMAAASLAMLALIAPPWFVPESDAGTLAYMAVVGAVSAALVALSCRRFKTQVALVGVAVLVGLVAANALTLNHIAAPGAQPLFEELSVEPAAGTYTSDGFIHLKTYYRMAAGAGYYDAFASAFSGSREMGGLPPYSVFNFREPLVFWLWQALPGGITSVYYCLIALLGVGFVSAYAIALAVVDEGFAFTAAVLLLPLSLFAVTTQFGLLVEAWALPVALASVAFSVWTDRIGPKASVAAAALAMLAVLMREIFALYLVAGLVYALVRRERAGRAAWGAAAGAVTCLLAVHYSVASARVGPALAPFSLEPWLHGGPEWIRQTAIFGHDVMLGWPWSVTALVVLGVGAAVTAPLPRLAWLARITVLVPLGAFTVIGLPPQEGVWPGAYWGLIYAPLALASVPLLARFIPGYARQARPGTAPATGRRRGG